MVVYVDFFEDKKIEDMSDGILGYMKVVGMVGEEYTNTKSLLKEIRNEVNHDFVSYYHIEDREGYRHYNIFSKDRFPTLFYWHPADANSTEEGFRYKDIKLTAYDVLERWGAKKEILFIIKKGED